MQVSLPGQMAPQLDPITPAQPDLEMQDIRRADPAPVNAKVVVGDWEPYQDQWLETPLFPPALQRLPRRFYKWRWMALYPFQWRLFGGLTTIGEVLLILLLTGVFWGAIVGVGVGFKAGRSVGGNYGPNRDPAKPNHDYITNTGQVAKIPLLLVWMLACHNSVWTFLFGIPFERALFWHQFMVWLTLSLGAYHGILGELGKGESQQYRDTGWVLWGLIVLLVLTSLWPVRRRLFEWFYKSHWVLFLLSAVFSVVHGAPQVLVGTGFWLLDVVIRSYMAGRRHAKHGLIARLPGNVVRIEWPKDGFRYAGGQYVFICVPAVSLWEWHPFSLSSHPAADKVSLHARVLGDWTKRLYELASKTDDAQPLKFYFEGPYGSPSVDIHGDTYKMFLLIAGGIGITPLQSVANSLNADAGCGRPVKKIWLVWSVRDNHLLGSVLPHDRTYRKQLSNRLPESFSPDVIDDELSADPADVQPENPLKDTRRLHTEFYLTKVRATASFKEANINPDVQPYLRFGRPDLPQIFAQMSELAKAYGEGKVAVMVCGPPSMMVEARRLSSAHSDRKVRFDCHQETFDL